MDICPRLFIIIHFSPYHRRYIVLLLRKHHKINYQKTTMSIMALEAIMFIFFYIRCIFLFFLQSFTLENEMSIIGFSMWKLKIHHIHCQNSMEHIQLGWQACKIQDSTHRKCNKAKMCNTINLLHLHSAVFTSTRNATWFTLQKTSCY
jgi:hypothetical protein